MPTVSSQGEVRIPEPLLRALNIASGTEVDFEQQGNALVMRVVKLRKASRPEDGPKILNYHGSTVTLEEMEAAIRKGAEDSL
ncbi:MAG: AbrB/MazE/SpoVT family DNA-binding domain-containing protein [Candidatus Competibacteraceae bacterium]|nr:AbrB/MazE/SpoVT family DNA-binding domain-containing protein [Candidatus Competibacteraceae bacterium]MCB1820037.1 AbrB/MazE/SpoVT family DNA-binding domain-containing protein [Candidatus Competibacteraceae bacterium]